DEYVVTIVNRGDAPLVIEDANLIDRTQAMVGPGDDPWALERQGQNWWKQVRSGEAGSLFVLGGGTVLAGTLAATSASIAAAVMAVDATLPGVAFYGGVAAGATVVAVALPLYAVALVAINHRNK